MWYDISLLQEIHQFSWQQYFDRHVFTKLEFSCFGVGVFSSPTRGFYISSCHKAHKVLTLSFYPLRFAAKALTVVHDCHPAARLSSSTIPLHVVFSRPGLLLPSGLHSNTVTQCSSLLYLITCPIQFNIRRLISSLALFTPVISWICWCEIVAILFSVCVLYICTGKRPASLLLFS